MSDQLLLFQEKTEDKILREFEMLKEKYERNRRSLHAKNGDLSRKYDELKTDLEFLKSAICTGKTVNLF